MKKCPMHICIFEHLSDVAEVEEHYILEFRDTALALDRKSMGRCSGLYVLSLIEM